MPKPYVYINQRLQGYASAVAGSICVALGVATGGVVLAGCVVVGAVAGAVGGGVIGSEVGGTAGSFLYAKSK
jgi:hypothetical protein